MASSTPSFTATFKEFPDTLRFAFLLAVGFMIFIIWDQWYWWNTREDYSFGFLVPLFVAYVIFDRWEQIVGLVKGDEAKKVHAEKTSRLPTWLETLLRAAAWTAIIGGSLLFFAGALIRAGGGAQNPASLSIALGFGVILLPIIFLNSPHGYVGEEKPDNWWQALWQDRRVQLTGLFIFVAFIWIISAPMTSFLEKKLNVFLLAKVTTVVVFVFDMGGFPLEQRANVLVLPNGSEVGVAEACSGIRSLTACLFAGSFLGAVFLNKYWKKVALIGVAMCLAVFTNLLRSLFLTSWAYRYGADAIGGFVHDAAGYAVLGLTCIGLICLLPIFNFQFKFEEIDEDWEDDEEADEKEGALELETAGKAD
ncbi:MAG TPA: exosortase/archaeosortase family protein [Opitutales bacterium]|nr:exosortase/archaeosortase family protein [Opitutales bacterium]